MSSAGAAKLRSAATNCYTTVTNMEWTAVEKQMPKPGKPVLIAMRNSHGKGRRLRAVYAARFTLPVSDEDNSGFGEYDEATDEYYCPEGWYEQNEFEETHWAVDGEVTDWMPLPPLPESYNVKVRGAAPQGKEQE